MSCFDMSPLITLFKSACTLATAFMVGFWILKFQKNDDLSVIEYTELQEVKNVVYPEFSICFLRPFLVNKIEEINKNISFDEYSQYLEGKEEIDERYRYINFNNVSFELFHHLSDYEVKWKDGNETKCEDRQKCSFATFKISFEGSIFKRFYRCFSVGIKENLQTHVKFLVLKFKASLLKPLSEIRDANKRPDIAMATFNYPQQVLKFSESTTYIWRDSKKSVKNSFAITAMEILKRRNKYKKPCVVDWMHFDNLVSNKHLETIGCRTPYQNTLKPICGTRREMLESVYDLSIVRKKYYPDPCEEMSNIVYSFNKLRHSHGTWLGIEIAYPDKIKIITQSQSVDAQSLIGNIGGYIGLFLGKGVKYKT